MPLEKLAATMQQLAEVVVRRRIGRVGVEHLLIGAHRPGGIAHGIERDAKIDLRLRIPWSEGQGLAIQFAGPR